jgi:hypothetical protein
MHEWQEGGLFGTEIKWDAPPKGEPVDRSNDVDLCELVREAVLARREKEWSSEQEAKRLADLEQLDRVFWKLVEERHSEHGVTERQRKDFEELMAYASQWKLGSINSVIPTPQVTAAWLTTKSDKVDARELRRLVTSVSKIARNLSDPTQDPICKAVIDYLTKGNLEDDQSETN